MEALIISAILAVGLAGYLLGRGTDGRDSFKTAAESEYKNNRGFLEARVRK